MDVVDNIDSRGVSVISSGITSHCWWIVLSAEMSGVCTGVPVAVVDSFDSRRES